MRVLIISILLLSVALLSACTCGTTITNTVTQTEAITTTITNTVTPTKTVTTTLTIKLTDSIDDYLSAVLLLEGYADRVDIGYYPEGNELVSVVLQKDDSRFTELLQILKDCTQYKILPRYTTTIENGVTETITITIDYGRYPCFHFVLTNGDTMSFSLSDYVYYENDNAFYLASYNEIDFNDFLLTINR